MIESFSVCRALLCAAPLLSVCLLHQHRHTQQKVSMFICVLEQNHCQTIRESYDSDSTALFSSGSLALFIQCVAHSLFNATT